MGSDSKSMVNQWGHKSMGSDSIEKSMGSDSIENRFYCPFCLKCFPVAK